MNKPEEQLWSCPKCGYLLGRFRAGRLHLGMRKTRYLVVGSVISICPGCREVVEVHITPPDARTRGAGESACPSPL